MADTIGEVECFIDEVKIETRSSEEDSSCRVSMTVPYWNRYSLKYIYTINSTRVSKTVKVLFTPSSSGTKRNVRLMQTAIFTFSSTKLPKSLELPRVK